MEKLPAEIHHEIYRLACLDDGLTGCALSAVSRYLREISADYRYRCIALNNARQVSLFCRLIRSNRQNEQAELIVVHHLYVCTGRFRPDAVDEVIEDRSQRWALRDLRVMLGVLEDSLQSLAFATPGIYNLGSAVSASGLRGDELTLIFPNLCELFISGPVVFPTTSSFAPRLAILHLYRNPSTFRLQHTHLRRWLPRLTHLQMSASSHGSALDFLAQVREAAGRMGILSREELRMMDAHPAMDGPTDELNGRLIAIEGDNEVINAFTALMRRYPLAFKQARQRFIIRPPRPHHRPAQVEPLIKTHWLERLQGKPYCWPIEKAV